MRNSSILKWAQNNKNNKLINGKKNDKKWIHQPAALQTGHVVYLVKFLGNTEVDKPKGIEVVKQGVQKLKFNQQLKKAEGGNSSAKTPKVEMTISVDGVTIQDPKSKAMMHQYPLHKISYCADDKAEKRFFSFIAKEGDTNRHTCFVFVSDKLAEEITLTIGQAFELAYKKFLDTSGKEKEVKRTQLVQQKRISLLEKENAELKKRLKDIANIKGPQDIQKYMNKNNITDICEVRINENDSTSLNGSLSNGGGNDNDSNHSAKKPEKDELINLDSANNKLDGFSLDDLHDDDFNPRAFAGNSDSDDTDEADFAAARPTRQSGQSPESAMGGPTDGGSGPVVARCSPANPEPENKRTSQIWFNPHFRPPKTSATPPQPPGPARVRPLAAIHINPAAHAWVGGPPGPGPNVHINPHKLHARQPVRHALSSTRITPWARPTLTPPVPAVRQILVNPHFARVPAQPAQPVRPARALAGTTPPPRLESVTTPLRAWGVSGRSLAKFKKIGRHKLIKLKSPAPFWAALTGSAHRHRTLPAVGGTPTPPHRLRPRQTLAHLRQMLTPQAKSRRSVHRQIDRRPQTRPAPRPRPASPPLHPTGAPPPPLKPVPPPKPARTIQINGSAYRVSRNGRQLQRVHPGPVPVQPPVAPAAVGPQRVYLAQGGEFVEAAPGILRLSRESMTRQSITHARKKSIQTLLRSQTKSKQFCMFFNKFGRCQKRAQGLCPYLHDPAKVAVCRRFLQGSCPKAADECLLTHKVSPDKMPACKFFQLGQCGRDHCPYNHVKVSADAALCPAFRQGYCPQGQACTLRHAMSDQTKAKVNPAPPKPRRKGVKEPKPVLPQSADPQPTLEPADSIMPSQRYFECAKDSPQADSPSTCPDPPVEVETKSQMAFWPEFIALEPDDEGASDPDQSFEERLV